MATEALAWKVAKPLRNPNGLLSWVINKLISGIIF